MSSAVEAGTEIRSFHVDIPDEALQDRGHRSRLQAYPNLIYFNEVDKGGHFAAWGEPELFSTEVRAAFRSLR